jgi:CRISPR-associated protein Cas1
VTENYHIQLKENTAKALIEKIKLNMNAKTVFKGKDATYQTILYRGMQTLANFVIDLTVKRNDSLVVQ